MIDNKTISSLRMLSVDMIEKAKSGHPGLPLGSAPMLYTLYKDFLNFNPEKPKWINRDRFVLSAGHGSAILYSLLNLFGFDVSIDDIKNFRQWGSKTPGHPEYGDTDGVDATTGPLGQGITMAVGMALAEAHMRSHFTVDGWSPVDHYTYALVGDGCLMEGISHEAASFAGSHKLGRLIVLYDSNNISIEGNTEITFHDDTLKRFEAYGWHTQRVEDGNDTEKIKEAIENAKKDERPSIIEVKTVIGFGAGSVEGSEKSHGAPIGEDNRKALVEKIKWNETEEFTVPEDVKENAAKIVEEKKKVYDEYKKKLQEYESKNPDKYREYIDWIHFKHEADLSKLLDSKEKDATRSASGAALQEVAKAIPNMIGGSADLGPSNNSQIKDSGFISSSDYNERNIHFGVREFAMAAISNGIALHGGLKPFCATFFVFSDYMKPAMRLAALMNLPVTYILTHDSIGVGEDGPTHEPIEHLAMLRSLPNFSVIRPADFNETVYAWEVAQKATKPTALILSRQKLETLKIESENLKYGAYIAKTEKDKLDLVVVATGSEVGVTMEASKILEDKGYGVRVVSMPSWDLFDEQDEEYRESVLPCGVKTASVEALSTFGWDKYTKGGLKIGLDRFGASAPGSELFEHFGFTPEKIADKLESFIKEN
ncbi:transketolase [Ezakiella coagulans]|uniref:Transketolase n=1 Tax=Ezakiella coagulans TaxID=46507 RepID=A0A2U1E1V0_9FIRM|nr:transketolase [Ezakiella coagulans]PVY93881.1 transketolase [Ezakiella coagulans]